MLQNVSFVKFVVLKLNEMKRPDLKGIKNKDVIAYIEHLEAQLNTPYFNSFKSIKKIVDNGNRQIDALNIDIFTPEGEYQFKLVSKFANSIKDLFDQMEYLKSKMSPDEAAEANRLIVKPEGVEQFIREKGDK